MHLNPDLGLASISTGTSPPAEEPSTSDHGHDLVRSVRNTIIEPSRNPRFLGPSSGVTLATMVMSSINVNSIPPRASSQEIQRYTSATLTPLSDEASSLPPRHAADHLVEVYFQYRTPHLPIIEETQVRKAVDNALSYSSDDLQAIDTRRPERDLFTSYMVFAIALCNVPNPTGGTGRPLQSGGCFRSAILWIEKVITFSKSDIEKLRAILLLAQFVSMCPWQGSLWHLTGIALRLCVDMGLHWETEDQTLKHSPEALFARRRLWFSAYYFDRVLGITLGRPFGITDESVRVSLPNPWAVSKHPLSRGHEIANDCDIHHQRAQNHLFIMAQLESEIRHIHQSQTWAAKIAYPRPNYTAWLQDVQPRLQEWYDTIPDPALAHHPMSIFSNRAFWDSLYNNAILLLHRPNPTRQNYSPDALTASFDAATNMIASIKVLQQDGRLDVLWKAVYDLFMAGLTHVFCVWQSPLVRTSQPASKIIATLQSCTSTLSAMSVNFAGAIGCRDAFDALSTATIEWLLANTSGAEEAIQSKARFEKQLGDLWEEMQPRTAGEMSRVWERPNIDAGAMNDMSMMFSSNSFAFGEILSLAAQSPDIENFDASLMGFDAMLS